MEFTIPDAPSILINNNGSQYRVQQFIKEIDNRNIPLIFNELNAIYAERELYAILEPRFFDSLFSILYSFKELSEELIGTVFAIIITGTDDLQRLLASLSTNTAVVMPTSEQKRLRNALKMYVYLLTWISYEVENLETTHHNSKKPQNLKSKKIELADYQDTSIAVLSRLISLNLKNILWSSISLGVEDSFFNSIVRLINKFIENPKYTKTSSPASRTHLINIMGNIAGQNNTYEFGFIASTINMVLKFEHLSPFFSDMIAMFNKEGLANPAKYVAEIIRDISKMDFLLDSNDNRNILRFLIELSEKTPCEVYQSIAVLQPHLNNKLFVVRNVILEVLSKIIIKVLTAPTKQQKTTAGAGLHGVKDQQIVSTNNFTRDDFNVDNDDNNNNILEKSRQTYAANRDEFLSILLAHCIDENTFVRKKSLLLWGVLCEERAVPKQFIPDIMAAIVGRFKDKSKMVRQQAMVTLKKFLQQNQFGSSLRLSEFVKLYESESHKMSLLKSQLTIQFDQDQHDLNKSLSNQRRLSMNVSFAVRAEVQPSLLNTSIQAIHNYALDGSNADIKVDTDCAAMEEEASQLKRQRKCEAYIEDSPAYKNMFKVLCYLSDAVNFITQIHNIIPFVHAQLSSSTNSDLIEAIDFIMLAYDYEIELVKFNSLYPGTEQSTNCIKKMIGLVFHDDPVIKNKIVSAYIRFYFSMSDSTMLVRNLILLFNDSLLLSELKALEILIVAIDTQAPFSEQVIELIFNVFCKKVVNTTEEQSVKALIMLSYLCKSRPDIAFVNQNLLIETGFSQRGHLNPMISQYTASAISTIACIKSTPRLSNSSKLFTSMIESILHSSDSFETDVFITLNNWYNSAESIIEALYTLSENPDQLASSLIIQHYAKLVNVSSLLSDYNANITRNHMLAEPLSTMDVVNNTANTEKILFEGDVTTAYFNEHGQSIVLLARFLFLLGHVAIKQLIHLEEIDSISKVRKSLAKAENDRQKNEANSKASSVNKNVDDSLFISEDSPKDFGLGSIVNDDDTDSDKMAYEIEHELILGSGLLSKFVPLIERVCRTKCNDPFLGPPSILTLCKFMCLSSVYCEKNLPILFTILNQGTLPQVKMNIIVALGDLAFRFPNCIEPWTPEIYLLLDKSNLKIVRKTALMVVSHLILNSMLKAKGQIGSIAICLVDIDPELVGLANLFFLELSKKDKGIYNVLPDIVGHLSSSISITKQDFRKVVDKLITYIDKDRQLESLFDKLLQRYTTSDNPDHWVDNTYCLYKIITTERLLLKLIDKLDVYKRVVYEEKVFSLLNQILKSNEKSIKPENKAEFDEYKDKLKSIHYSRANENQMEEMDQSINQLVRLNEDNIMA